MYSTKCNNDLSAIDAKPYIGCKKKIALNSLKEINIFSVNVLIIMFGMYGCVCVFY